MQSSAVQMCKEPKFGAFREDDSLPPKKSCAAVRNSLDTFASPAYTLPVTQKRITGKQIIKSLKDRQGARSNRQFAFELGISPAHLGDIYNGKRNPGEKVLSQLGLTKRTVKSDPIYEAV